MSAKIYVEGGGDSESTLAQCRNGFTSYCAGVAGQGRRPKIVACGGRQQAFDRFKTAVQTGHDGEVLVLLVDAEGPVTAKAPTEHLHARDGWVFPKLDGDCVFLMVQAMEAWFLADREALAAFYGDGFLARSLPGNPANIESVPKRDVGSALKHASKPTKTKGEYQKVKHGFALLALINPHNVEAASPHAARFHDFLRSL